VAREHFRELFQEASGSADVLLQTGNNIGLLPNTEPGDSGLALDSICGLAVIGRFIAILGGDYFARQTSEVLYNQGGDSWTKEYWQNDNFAWAERVKKLEQAVESDCLTQPEWLGFFEWFSNSKHNDKSAIAKAESWCAEFVRVGDQNENRLCDVCNLGRLPSEPLVNCSTVLSTTAPLLANGSAGERASAHHCLNSRHSSCNQALLLSNQQQKPNKYTERGTERGTLITTFFFFSFFFCVWFCFVGCCTQLPSYKKQEHVRCG
jgi:hypothetical protein